MTQEERIAQFEQENAELRAKLAEAYQQITQLTEPSHARCLDCRLYPLSTPYFGESKEGRMNA